MQTKIKNWQADKDGQGGQVDKDDKANQADKDY